MTSDYDFVMSFIQRQVEPPTQPPERKPSPVETDATRDEIVRRLTSGDPTAWFGKWALIEGDDEGRLLDVLRFALAMPSASDAQRWQYVERKVRDIAEAIAEEEAP